MMTQKEQFLAKLDELAREGFNEWPNEWSDAKDATLTLVRALMEERESLSVYIASSAPNEPADYESLITRSRATDAAIAAFLEQKK